MGRSWSKLEPSWAKLGPSWSQVGILRASCRHLAAIWPSGCHLELSWRQLEGIWSHLEANLRPKRADPEKATRNALSRLNPAGGNSAINNLRNLTQLAGLKAAAGFSPQSGAPAAC